MHKEQLELLTCKAVQTVETTANFIREELGKVKTEQIEEKFLNGLVSYVDRSAEEMLVNSLSDLLPGSVFLTEEDTIDNREGEFQWIIDPLDGTTNFLHAIPHFAVSVGLKAGDELVLGIVCHVTNREIYYAWKDGGAFCNGKPLRVSRRSTLRESLIATGFPYHNFEQAESWFVALRQFMEKCRGVRRFGAAALDLAYVAAGHYEMFFEYGLSPWDVAGGAVLVKEAGGRVSTFAGGNDFLHSGQIVAANDSVYQEVLEILQAAY